MDEDRRKICQVLGAAAVTSVIPGGCGGSGQNMQMNTVFTVPANIQKAAGIMLNDFFFATGPGVNVNICRDSGGLFAQDADCTHAQCLLQFETDNPQMPQWTCNCHGSKFDFVGTVLNPPAPKPLVHYQLVVNMDGSMTFDLSKIVDPSTRTMG
jgi:nitrite reductase/ring-hydroxylating ferredoxin subunit